MSYNRERFQANRYIIENKEGKDIATMGGKELSRWAKDTAEAMVKGDRLKTHQLRNIYAAVNKLRTKFQHKKSVTEDNSLLDELYLLMPQLAYAAGRQRAVNATLFPFMQAAIKAVDEADDKNTAFRNFFVLVESVVGFHKFFQENRSAEVNIG